MGFSNLNAVILIRQHQRLNASSETWSSSEKIDHLKIAIFESYVGCWGKLAAKARQNCSCLAFALPEKQLPHRMFVDLSGLVVMRTNIPCKTESRMGQFGGVELLVFFCYSS
jgi:hypothetical protein